MMWASTSLELQSSSLGDDTTWDKITVHHQRSPEGHDCTSISHVTNFIWQRTSNNRRGSEAGDLLIRLLTTNDAYVLHLSVKSYSEYSHPWRTC